MAVFGYVSDAAPLALVRVCLVDALAFKQYLARRRLAQTREYLDKLCLPVAFNARHAERLAAAHFK